MNSRENFLKTLNHKNPSRIVMDFGSTPTSGIHVRIVELLREHFGLEKKPVQVVEPYQMLGKVDDDLVEAMGIDVIGLSGQTDMFGIKQENWKEFKTHWGQVVLVPGGFNVTYNEKGATLMSPGGDTSLSPSAMMPSDSYFFDAIVRQEPFDEASLNPEDNLEEYGLISEADVAYWKENLKPLAGKGKGVVANIGGTGIGDIALVPGMSLAKPKGIRDISEWYMSTMMRPDFVHAIFEKQTDLALKNLEKVNQAAGGYIDVAFVCGTDFGTQESTFCAPETYVELWAPYYKKINNWIHQNTSWKTFKHSCGAVSSFLPLFIESGFDIINPVQINAAGMDPTHLKSEFGRDLVFWGGGIDTQKILPFGTTDEVKAHVHKECEILSPGGGFVFNSVHNVQANVPLENFLAMLETVRQFNS